jgi:hypothetical protein
VIEQTKEGIGMVQLLQLSGIFKKFEARRFAYEILRERRDDVVFHVEIGTGELPDIYSFLSPDEVIFRSTAARVRA